MNIALIYMASGKGVRFGSNKLLTHICGQPLYQYGFQALQQAISLVVPRGITCTVYVISPYREIREWCRTRGALVSDNPDAEEGISSSIRIGTACGKNSDAIAFFVADQPLLQARNIADFLAGYAQNGCSLGAVTAAGRLGNPAVFSSSYVPKLLALHGDQGGKKLLHEYDDCLWRFPVPVEELLDVDTGDDMKIVETAISKDASLIKNHIE